MDNTRTKFATRICSRGELRALTSEIVVENKGNFGEPGGTRTRDPMLKRHMLYRLSYRPSGGVLRRDSLFRIA